MGFGGSRGKIVISGGSGHISGIFRVAGGPWCKKDRALCKIWGILKDFSGILEGLGV
jgi:hypothetical protein